MIKRRNLLDGYFAARRPVDGGSDNPVGTFPDDIDYVVIVSCLF